MIILWSVELDANNYEDDIFNGSYEECIDYCNEHGYIIGSGARLAKILIHEDGYVIECLEIVEEI